MVKGQKPPKPKVPSKGADPPKPISYDEALQQARWEIAEPEDA